MSKHVCFLGYGVRRRGGGGRYKAVESQFLIRECDLHNIAPANAVWNVVWGDEVLHGFKAVIYFSHSETSMRTIVSVARRHQELNDPLSWWEALWLADLLKSRTPTPSASAASERVYVPKHPQKLITCIVGNLSITHLFLPKKGKQVSLPEVSNTWLHCRK